MQLLLQELGAFGTSMAIIDAEPFRILLEVNCYFVLVVLAIYALVGNGGISFKMRGHISTDGFRDLRQLLGWLFCRLFLFAFLAGIAQKRSFECLCHEVGGNVVLNHASRRDDFFEAVAGCAWFNEGLLLLGLRSLYFTAGMVWLHDMDVL